MNNKRGVPGWVWVVAIAALLALTVVIPATDPVQTDYFKRVAGEVAR